ncbi:unnamed protein product [marine sediment metagenome]|uniref:Uncharacterized protein n=1 Tax=marine sediment metagenome TaxID=412755 RepID=X1NVL6_9ZZZZ
MATKKELEGWLGKSVKFRLTSGSIFVSSELKAVDERIATLELEDPNGKRFDCNFYIKGIKEMDSP